MQDQDYYFDHHTPKGTQIIISINGNELLKKLKGVGFGVSVCSIVCVHA